MSKRTLFQVLRDTAALHGAKPALTQPGAGEAPKQPKTWTWDEHFKAVQELAMGLDSLGIRKGDIVALCSETRAEFYLADIAIMALGGISAALYQSYPAKDLLKTIEASGARALFVENPKVFDQLREAPVEYFLLMTGAAEGALSFEDLQARGRAASPSSRPPSSITANKLAIAATPRRISARTFRFSCSPLKTSR